MEWQSVSSRAVRAIAYDPELMVIYVEYNDGDRYYYENCPIETWTEFSKPEVSKGQFVNSELKRHRFGKYSG